MPAGVHIPWGLLLATRSLPSGPQRPRASATPTLLWASWLYLIQGWTLGPAGCCPSPACHVLVRRSSSLFLQSLSALLPQQLRTRQPRVRGPPGPSGSLAVPKPNLRLVARWETSEIPLEVCLHPEAWIKLLRGGRWASPWPRGGVAVADWGLESHNLYNLIKPFKL